MSRMSREFTLVLLGAGVLTAGYFAAPSPEDDLEKKADRQAADRVHAAGADNTGGNYHRPYYGHTLLFVHSMGYTGGSANGRPATAMSSVSRGGFGGMGARSAGG